MLFTSVAACGALLTFASLRLMQTTFRRKLGRRTTAVALFSLIVLGSFGVGLGRYYRFNSWDVVRKPNVLAEKIANSVVDPAEEPGVTGGTLVLTALLTFGYFGVLGLAPPPEPTV